MKKNSLFLFAFCFFQLTYAQKGVQFFEGSWENLLKKAQIENKPIFIDVYADWSKPCKFMDMEAFRLSEKVGEVLNTHFISYRIEAEKSEGQKFVKNYEVEDYPTLLFLRPNGELFHKTSGYSGVNPLLYEIEQAQRFFQELATIEPFIKEYEKGNRERAFLWSYVEKRKASGLEYGEVYNEYLKTLPTETQHSKPILEQICRYITNLEGLAMEIVTQKYAFYYDSLKGRDISSMERNLKNSIKKSRKKAIEKKDFDLIKRVAQATELLQETPNPKEIEEIYLDFYYQTKNRTEFEPKVQTFVEKYLKVENLEKILQEDSVLQKVVQKMYIPAPSDQLAKIKRDLKNRNGRPIGEQLNHWAWASYELSENQELLEKALEWSEKAILLCQDHSSLHTKAHLLWKLGRKKEAIQTQTQAVRLFDKMYEEGLYEEREADEIRQKLHTAWNEMNR